MFDKKIITFAFNRSIVFVLLMSWKYLIEETPRQNGYVPLSGMVSLSTSWCVEQVIKVCLFFALISSNNASIKADEKMDR